MAVTLGIHIGHNASCAVVQDGCLTAAIQQERLSRVKHDVEEALSNRLPVAACLAAAGRHINDVDYIVTSFQSVSPGGFGLHKPLVEPDFDLFDPADPRHIVLSHHQAHAFSAFCTAGVPNACVLVTDLAGSTTLNGEDYALPFEEWREQLSSMHDTAPVWTEALSIYDADTIYGLRLCYREFREAHNQPASFIQNTGSLYNNVSRAIFGVEHAEGQTMALSAYGDAADAQKNASNMVTVTEAGEVRFHNDWQHNVQWDKSDMESAQLAAQCQAATVDAVRGHVQRARQLSSSDSLVAAGGVFLNILTNSEVARSDVFRSFHVPSAPHDAGIAVGCAYYGDSLAKGRRLVTAAWPTDRLGLCYTEEEVLASLRERDDFLTWHPATVDGLVSLLVDGAVVARHAGRSEFGPRALGGRSLLATPLRAASRDILNHVKGRQAWRPVAPVVPLECATDFFNGQTPSPYMLFAHTLKSPAHELPALCHPDGTTRAQTISVAEDPGLHALLNAFGRVTGYPILVNTSLNGPGEPIVEHPAEALEFFLSHERVDALVIGSFLVTRRAPWEGFAGRQVRIRPRAGTLVSIATADTGAHGLISRGGETRKISGTVLSLLLRDTLVSVFEGQPRVDEATTGPIDWREVWHLLANGYVVAEIV